MKLKAIEGFDATHSQFLMKGQRYILPATGCLQFLLASTDIRRAAVQTSGVCPICLARPRQRLPTGACKNKHAIARRSDGRHNALCMKVGCEYHHLVCLEHEEMNKEHPHNKRSDTFIEDIFQEYPQLEATATTTSLTLPSAP